MRLVAGLGNPGAEYEGTRHNVGFATADLLASRWGVRWKRGRCQAMVCQASLGAAAVVLAKPWTFMNRSGVALECLLRSCGASPAELVAIHDDLDLPLGRVRVKVGGGSAGHRGVESMIERIGDAGFVRIRIGIGRPGPGREAVEYVLERFSAEEEDIVAKAISRAADAVESLFTEGIARTLNAFNGTS